MGVFICDWEPDMLLSTALAGAREFWCEIMTAGTPQIPTANNQQPIFMIVKL